MFCAKLESKPSFLKVLSRMIRIYAGIYILRGINYVTYLVPAFVKLEVNGSEIFTKLQKKKEYLRIRRIELRAKPWKGFMLPLHHMRFMR